MEDLRSRILNECKEKLLKQPPRKVSRGDCCNEGCIPCVLVSYNDMLDRWLSSIEAHARASEELRALAKEYVKQEKFD